VIDVGWYCWVAIIAEGVESKRPLDSDLTSLIYTESSCHLGPTSRVSYRNEVDCARLANDVRDAVSIRKPRRCPWPLELH
jgi:hypothetical protein